MEPQADGAAGQRTELRLAVKLDGVPQLIAAERRGLANLRDRLSARAQHLDANLTALFRHRVDLQPLSGETKRDRCERPFGRSIGRDEAIVRPGREADGAAVFFSELVRVPAI